MLKEGGIPHVKLPLASQKIPPFTTTYIHTCIHTYIPTYILTYTHHTCIHTYTLQILHLLHTFTYSNSLLLLLSVAAATVVVFFFMMFDEHFIIFLAIIKSLLFVLYVVCGMRYVVCGIWCDMWCDMWCSVCELMCLSDVSVYVHCSVCTVCPYVSFCVSLRVVFNSSSNASKAPLVRTNAGS